MLIFTHLIRYIINTKYTPVSDHTICTEYINSLLTRKFLMGRVKSVSRYLYSSLLCPNGMDWTHPDFEEKAYFFNSYRMYVKLHNGKVFCYDFNTSQKIITNDFTEYKVDIEYKIDT